MAVKISDDLSVPAASSKLAVALAIGLAAGGLAALTISWRIAPLIAWDAAAIVFLSATWPRVLKLDARLVRSHALREDSSRVMSDLVLVTASVASLGAVLLVLTRGGSATGGALIGDSLLALLSIVLSWLVIHTVFALRYAEMYYTAPVGGVEFGEGEQPTYLDFAYLAFTVGMTYQVSDTPFSRRTFRAVALRHVFLSYLFGTIIIAATINLIAGLGK
jgi:uncharacterized membrane protein